MINNFDNFSWDYNAADDPYAKRSASSFPTGGGGSVGPKEPCYTEIVFFHQLEEALLGVVEHTLGPPVACYSRSIALAILQQEHGLTPEDARFALTQLIDCDLGPAAPCFLDTSIVEKE